MYLYYCYRDRYDYLYTTGFFVTYLKLHTLVFTTIGSFLHSLTYLLCSVSVSDRMLDGIDNISLEYGNTLLSIDT